MTPKRIILHCSDTKNGLYTPASAIKRWHIEKGWSDIGYHEVIQPTGDMEHGRALNVTGAHCEGENYDSIGLCLVGRTAFTKKAFSTLRARLEILSQTYSIEPYKIYTHAQFQSAIRQSKTCPNIPINDLLGWYILKDESIMTPYIYTGIIE